MVKDESPRAGIDGPGHPSGQSKGARRAARAVVATLGLATMVAARPAFAQRGQDFAPTEERAVSPNPNQGFPGLFDTEVAPKGAFVANLPGTSLQYGVTSRLTLGTITAAFASVAVGSPSASVSARYLLGGANWFRSTVDALMLASSWTDSGGQATLRLGLFTSNTELVLNRRNRLIAHAWLAHGSVGGEVPLSATVFVVGGTYSVVLASWASLHVTGMYLASVSGRIDAPGTVLDIDFTNAIRPIDHLIARATVSMRRGRWLFDLGVLRAGNTSFGGIWPWINVAVQMGTP